MDEKGMTLDKAAEELLKYSEDHVYNPLELKPVLDEFARDVMFGGELHHLTLTKMDFGDKWAYMLSMSKISDGKYSVPDDEDQEAIVQVFFPIGIATRIDNTALQVLPSVCVKYLHLRSKT